MTQITFYGGVEEIGGNKILVESSAGTIILDFGRRMGFNGNYFAEFIQPRSKNALSDMCRLGVLPYLNGVYAKQFIDTTTLVKDPDNLKKIPLESAPDYWTMKGISPYDPNEPNLDAVFVTHAHFDHIQDISFLDPAIPVHCTEETKVVAKAMGDVSVAGVDDQYFEMKRDQAITPKKQSSRTVFPGELEYSDIDVEEKPCILDTKCGYEFTHEYEPKYRVYDTSTSGKIKGIEYKMIPVDHSIPGACSVLLTLPDRKRLLYTGDLRFHGTKRTTTDDYVSQVGSSPDILIIEGTRIDSTETLTEDMVQERIRRDIEGTKGLVLINFGWKDLSRFEVVYEASKANGRALVISPKLAYILFEMYTSLPTMYSDPRKLPNLRVYLKREGSLLYSKTDYDKWKMGYLDFHGRNSAKTDHNLVRVAEALNCGGANCSSTTPVSGPDTPKEITDTWDLATYHLEHGIRAYEIREKPSDYVLMFSPMDVNELFDLIPQNSDWPQANYISASTEPFSDEMEIDESRLMNWLDAFGVSYESEVDEKGHTHFIRRHVSGHASQLELLELIDKLKPGMIIPIHTTKPHLFGELLQGKTIKIPEYGKPIPL